MPSQKLLNVLIPVSRNQSYTLDFSDVVVTKADWQIILDAITVNRSNYAQSKLRGINFVDCEINDSFLLAILQALPASVISLSFNSNDITVAGLNILSQFLSSRAVLKLDLSNNPCFVNCSLETFQQFMAGLRVSCAWLEDLSLEQTALSNDHVLELSSHLSDFRALKNLSLSNLRAEPHALATLFAQLKNTTIRCLCLDDVIITPVIDAFCEAIASMKVLKELSLNRCDLTTIDVENICDACSTYMPHLQILALEDNSIADDSVSRLIRLLRQGLAELNLAHNNITDTGALEFAEYFSTSTNHLSICLANNGLSVEVCKDLENAAVLNGDVGLDFVDSDNEEEEIEEIADAADFAVGVQCDQTSQAAVPQWPLVASTVAASNVANRLQHARQTGDITYGQTGTLQGQGQSPQSPRLDLRQ